MVYRCYRHRGQLDVILEPLKHQQKQQQKQKQENPPRLPGQEERCDGRPQQRSPQDREALPAGVAGQGAGGGDPGQGPDPLLNRVLTSTFRTGLSDVDLRLEAEENHGRG